MTVQQAKNREFEGGPEPDILAAAPFA